jgi:hypothetical protein
MMTFGGAGGRAARIVVLGPADGDVPTAVLLGPCRAARAGGGTAAQAEAQAVTAATAAVGMASRMR